VNNAARYENLPTNTRASIRRTMVAMIRQDPRPNATYSQRFDRAVRSMARKYGVRQATIQRVFADGAPSVHTAPWAPSNR
jgi:hypothetical protein